MNESLELKELKMTKQRKKIIELLSGSNCPLTAEELFLQAKTEFPAIALTTIYRNLETLSKHQLVNKIMCSDGTAKYLFIKNPHFHTHFLVCICCKKTIPLEHCPIQSLESNISNEIGFQITGHHLEIYGYCKDCKNRQKDLKGEDFY